MPKLLIFDPPRGCSMGTCSPDEDDASERFEAFLDDMQKEGVEVIRSNLGYHPKAFAENEIVKQILARDGVGSLPLTIVNDAVLTQGGYPTPEALERALGRYRLTPTADGKSILDADPRRPD